MKQTEIHVMNTLDKFGQREMALLAELLEAYTHANSFHDGKQYAALPDTWNDDGVYVDFNAYSGQVYLVNTDYCALINTDYGVGMWYYTPYAGIVGTLFELAGQLNDDLTDKDGNVVAVSNSGWHIDDLNYMYFNFENDALAFLCTDADLSPVYAARDNILKAIALDKLDTLPVELKDESDNIIVREALAKFEWDITDTETHEQLADFIRAELEKRYSE